MTKLIPKRIRNLLRPWKNPGRTFLLRHVWHKSSRRVIDGAFAGMVFPSIPDSPKLLGTYEMELRSALADIRQRSFERVINIGAGEGYYAVGLALLLEHAEVFAFEADSAKHIQIRELALQNRVEKRIKLYGRCDLTDLQVFLDIGSKTLVVMDVEGFERELLIPDLVPCLRNAVILVELHEGEVPGVTTLITQRFSLTHQLQLIPARSRGRADFPLNDLEFAAYSDSMIVQAMTENRCFKQDWLFCIPNTK